MVQSKGRLADMKDVPIMLGKEEFVSDTEQTKRTRHAVMNDAPTKLTREEFV